MPCTTVDINLSNVLAGACGNGSTIVAHLAYCAVGTDEKERRNRAKVVPCRVYQDLLVSGDIDLIEILASVDFQDVEIVRKRTWEMSSSILSLMSRRKRASRASFCTERLIAIENVRSMR